MVLENYTNLILNIYDCVWDPRKFANVFDECAQTLGAKGCIVFEWDVSGEERRLCAPLFSTNFDGEEIEEYIDYFREQESADQDIFEAYSMAHDKIDLIDDDVLCESDSELLQRPNSMVLQQYGLKHRAAGLLDKDNKNLSRFSLQFGIERDRMSVEEHALSRIILPHIAKALSLYRPIADLRSEHQATLDAMDKLAVGLCVLDSEQRVVASNSEFDRQCETHGTFQVDRTGKLKARQRRNQSDLTTLLGSLNSHGSFGARPRKEAIDAHNGDLIGSLCVEVAPLVRVDELGSKPISGALVYSLDTSRPFAFNSSLLTTAFSLTSAEAAIVPLLCQGMTNTEIAEERSRSIPTINTQVKAILAKTDCSNRTQFLRLVFSYASGLK